MKSRFIPANAPPPLTVQPYTIRTQKDSVEFVSTPKRKTFDDLETEPNVVRQSDSMTSHVNKVVNTPVNKPPAQITDGVCRGAGNFAPIPQNYGHVSSDRQIAQQPQNPNAIIVEGSPALFRDTVRKQSAQIPSDMNTVLHCHGDLNVAPIPASQLVNVNYKIAPSITY